MKKTYLSVALLAALSANAFAQLSEPVTADTNRTRINDIQNQMKNMVTQDDVSMINSDINRANANIGANKSDLDSIHQTLDDHKQAIIGLDTLINKNSDQIQANKDALNKQKSQSEAATADRTAIKESVRAANQTIKKSVKDLNRELHNEIMKGDAAIESRINNITDGIAARETKVDKELNKKADKDYVNRQISKISTDTSTATKDREKIKQHISNNDSRISEATKKIKTNTDHIKTNTDHIKTNTDDIKRNADQIKTLDDKKVDKDQYELDKAKAASARQKISDKVDANTSKIIKNKAEIKKLDEVSKKNREDIDKHSEQIKNLDKKKVDKGQYELDKAKAASARQQISDKVDVNTSKIITNKAEIQNVKKFANDNRAKITTNSHDIAVNRKEITKVDKYAHVNRGMINRNASAIGKNHKDILDLRQSFESMSKDYNQFKEQTYGAIAGLSAMSNIPSPLHVGKFNLGAGIGSYKDQGAVSVGVGYRPSENVALKASVATAAGDFDPILGAGLTYEFE